MLRTVLLSALLFAMTTSGQSFAEESKPKGAELRGFAAGSTVVEVFMKGLRDGNLDAVLATVDVPWYQDGTKILESKDALRDLLSEPIKERELADSSAKVVEVLQFKSLRDKASGTAGELLKKVAKDEDLVFLMKITVGTKSKDMMLLVRVNRDRAKIIGLRD